MFEDLCALGRFILLLDGFDEVSLDRQDELQKQILSFVDQFPDCTVVLSSRHEQRFAGWQKFTACETLPFTVHQVKELIKRVPFDRKYRDLFVKMINVEFYSKHESFLSNPLLAIMMLMSYRENFDISTAIHLFYEQVFITLFQWHDATKAYKRSKVFDIDQFQRSFSMFCLLSYYREMYEFSHTEIVDLILQSNKINHRCSTKAINFNINALWRNKAVFSPNFSTNNTLKQA